jgi:hypothetical protein
MSAHITPPYTLRGTHLVKLTGTPATVFIAEMVDCRQVDAEFIVQACNSRDALVALLTEAQRYIALDGSGDDFQIRCEAAILAATEGR